MTSIDKLPASLPCHDCNNTHFLTFNRDINGKWCAGYIEYKNHMANVFINDADTLDEASTRMEYAIERYKRRHGLDPVL